MEETDKDNEVSNNSDASSINPFGNLLNVIADYRKTLSKEFTISDKNYETSDSNMLLDDSQTFDDNFNKENKLREGFAICSFLLDNKNVPIFQANNSSQIPQKAVISKENLFLGRPCKISDSLTSIYKETSEKVSNIKPEMLNASCLSDNAVLSNTEFSDKESEASTSDSNQCKSLKCNSQTTPNNGTVLDSNLSMPSSSLKTSEKDPGASITEVFSEETLKKFRNIIHNQNFSYADFMDCDSGALKNSRKSSTEMKDSFITIDEARDYLKRALKFSNGPMNVIDYILSDSNQRPLEAATTSDKESEFRNSDLNTSFGEFSDSVQVSNQEKQSSNALLKSLKNLINTFSEFQDAVCQVTANEFSGLGNSLNNDQGSSLCADTKMEIEVPTKYLYAEDGYDYLSATRCFEDQNMPVTSYLSGNCSVPSKAITFWSNYSDLEFLDSYTETYRPDSKFSESFAEYSRSNSKFCEKNTESFLPNSKFSNSETDSYYSDLILSGGEREANQDKRSSEVLHVSKELQNRENINAEFSSIVKEKVFAAETVSKMEITPSNDRETFDNSEKTEERAASDIVDHSNLKLSKTDQDSKSKMQLPEDLQVTNHRNLIKTNVEFQGHIENKDIGLKVFSKTECSSFSSANLMDCNPVASGSSAINSKHSTRTSTSSMTFVEAKKFLSNLATDVSKFDRQLPDVLRNLKDHRNPVKSISEFRGLIENKGTNFQSFTKTKRSEESFGNSPETERNKMPINFINSDNSLGRERVYMSDISKFHATYRKPLSKDYLLGRNLVPNKASFSDGNSKTTQSSLKISIGDQNPLTFNQSKLFRDEVSQNLQNSKAQMVIKNADFSVNNTASDKDRELLNCCSETTSNSKDTIVDIFKTVIKCHPIKKYEIPPYESNTEIMLKKSKSPLIKYASNDSHLYDIDEHRNILECFSDIDSRSVMFFDFTDCFTQNSSIICDDLIKEYMNISAKVNLLLVKQMKDLSIERYDLRIHRLRCLDDELGYISAKLITTMNDWVKQFHEIDQNVAKSRIGSRGLYNMGILRICMQIVSILIKFTLEMQLKLENCESFLIFHHK